MDEQAKTGKNQLENQTEDGEPGSVGQEISGEPGSVGQEISEEPGSAGQEISEEPEPAGYEAPAGSEGALSEGRLSSYVREHIREDGKRRQFSIYRCLLFCALLIAVVFFFVDYVLMKRQLVSGWFHFAEETTTLQAGDGDDADPEAQSGTALSDVTGEESTGETASDGAPDSAEESDHSEASEQDAKGAETGDDRDTESSSGQEGTVESTEEPETAVDPAEEAAQYLVWIRVEEAAEPADLPEAEVTGTERNQTDTGTALRESNGVIVEIGQSVLRVLTDYASVMNAETIEVTFRGGESAQGKVTAADSRAGLALLEISAADLSNATLKGIRMATWGSTDTISGESRLYLAETLVLPDETGDADADETADSAGAQEEVIPSLAEVHVLTVGEKKLADTVFTTFSVDTEEDGCLILIDEDGDIVGIGSSEGAEDEEADGATSYIYSISDLKLHIEKMINGEETPYVGITGVTVTDEIKESVSIDMPYGVYVWLAATGSPAYQAGILNGDIITAIDGKEITTVQQMRDAIMALEIGEEVSFTLMRQGGNTYREYTIKVTPEAME